MVETRKQMPLAQPADDWMNAAQEVDQDTVEQVGPEYPFIQWVNGKRALKKAGGVTYTGGWFMPEGQAINEAMTGWEQGELIHDNGESTVGWFKRDVTLATIRMRRCWMAGDARYPWDQYDNAVAAGTPKGRLQVLVLVKDWQTPVMLTLTGTISQAFVGSRRMEGVLTRFNRLIVREANGINAKRGVAAKFPYRAFWLSVGPQRDAAGEPVFTEVGKTQKSTVTLPTALGLKDKPEAGDLAARFVGVDLLRTLNQMYADAEEWAKSWDMAQVQPAEEAPAEEPAIPNGEELPF